jgi:hypothetical protein
MRMSEHFRNRHHESLASSARRALTPCHLAAISTHEPLFSFCRTRSRGI